MRMMMFAIPVEARNQARVMPFRCSPSSLTAKDSVLEIVAVSTKRNRAWPHYLTNTGAGPIWCAQH